MTACRKIVFRRLVFGVFGVVSLVAMPKTAPATNLITNGNFSSGNTGFTSGYSHNTMNAGPELVEGAYSVVTKASDVHFAWGAYFDRTSGDSSGKYFVANASSDTSKTVWKSSVINVSQANTPYRFEAWLSMIYPSEGNPPQMTFEIGNGTSWTSLGQTRPFDLEVDSPGEWYFSYADAQFASTGDYYVRLRNDNGANGGNDLGLDDVYFGLRSSAPSIGTTSGSPSVSLFAPVSVPEPSSLAIAVAGIAGTGLAFRRRRS